MGTHTHTQRERKRGTKRQECSKEATGSHPRAGGGVPVPRQQTSLSPTNRHPVEEGVPQCIAVFACRMEMTDLCSGWHVWQTHTLTNPSVHTSVRRLEEAVMPATRNHAGRVLENRNLTHKHRHHDALRWRWREIVTGDQHVNGVLNHLELTAQLGSFCRLPLLVVVVVVPKWLLIHAGAVAS